MSVSSLEIKSMSSFPAQVGREYKRVILEAGGSVDGMDMLKTFLGRSPCQDAFFQCKGLNKTQETPKI